MKKAGEYFDEACIAFENRENKDYDIDDEPYFVEAIRKAQQDAIEETVKACAEAAKQKKYIIFSLWSENPTGESIVIDKDSIIDVANKLKEQL